MDAGLKFILFLKILISIPINFIWINEVPEQPREQWRRRSRTAEYLPNHMQRTITWLGEGNWGKRVATLATGAKLVQNSFVGLVDKLSYSSGQIKSRAVARRESLLR